MIANKNEIEKDQIKFTAVCMPEYIWFCQRAQTYAFTNMLLERYLQLRLQNYPLWR